MGPRALKSSQPAKRHELSVCVLAERAETPDAWLKDLDRVERAALQAGFDQVATDDGGVVAGILEPELGIRGRKTRGLAMAMPRRRWN